MKIIKYYYKREEHSLTNGVNRWNYGVRWVSWNYCIRQAKEETGLNIKELTLLGTTSGEDCFIEFPHGDKAFFITIGYVCKSYSVN